jgi:hypothetical protein
MSGAAGGDALGPARGRRAAGEERREHEAGATQAWLEALERALDDGTPPDLRDCTRAALDGALRELIRRRGAAAGPLLRTLAERAPAKDLRRTAKAAIYRLEQSGIPVPAPTPAPAPPAISRRAERPARSWLSGIDGSGSRAVWILFEGGVGGELLLCSLLLNDELGILEVAGGPISKKRLERELAALREDQKLPWVESEPSHACALVAEALDLHARAGSEPAAGFARWQRFFTGGSVGPAGDAAAPADPALLERSAELAELPELAGWFVDPAQVQEDGLALLQARESRLVVSDQIKAERESAIVDQVIDRLFTGDARRRWARRLDEMALIFRATARDERAEMAAAVAAALREDTRDARAIPLVRALASRGLEVASEVALGRVKLADVTRAPVRRSRE